MPDVAVAESPAASAAPSIRGPLDRLALVHVPGRLAVSHASPAARLLLRGDPGALGTAYGIDLPTVACRAVQAEDRCALWLGPDEWLLMAPLGTIAVAAVEGGAAVDVGHRQAGLVVEGGAGADVLVTGCPLDLHPRAFPPGMCTRTVLGKAEIVLWRQELERFHVEVWRSFAAYVHGRLETAAVDIGG